MEREERRGDQQHRRGLGQDFIIPLGALLIFGFHIVLRYAFFFVIFLAGVDMKDPVKVGLIMSIVNNASTLTALMAQGYYQNRRGKE